MGRFQFAHASGDSADALVAQCVAGLGVLPAGANLGIVYATDALADSFDRILSTLKRDTAVGHWLGTVGVGISATAREYYGEPALAILIASLPEDSFRMLAPQHGAVDEVMGELDDWLGRHAHHCGLLHADPANSATPAIIEQLAARVPGAFFVGGLTSSRGHQVQVADTLAVGGVSGVLFDGALPIVTGHTQGCTPIADSHVITACDRNILIELDGRPALEVFKEDIGEVMARDLSRVGGYIFAGLPIAGSDTGDYLVRNLLGLDRERGLLAIGEYLAPGRTLMFCRRDGNSARQDLERMLGDIKRRMGQAPRGALYHSCLGRGRHQFGPDSAELRLIADALGDLPLVGFFANGEIFHNRLYAYTGVLTVFC